MKLRLQTSYALSEINRVETKERQAVMGGRNESRQVARQEQGDHCARSGDVVVLFSALPPGRRQRELLVGSGHVDCGLSRFSPPPTFTTTSPRLATTADTPRPTTCDAVADIVLTPQHPAYLLAWLPAQRGLRAALAQLGRRHRKRLAEPPADLLAPPAAFPLICRG